MAAAPRDAPLPALADPARRGSRDLVATRREPPQPGKDHPRVAAQARPTPRVLQLANLASTANIKESAAPSADRGSLAAAAGLIATGVRVNRRARGVLERRRRPDAPWHESFVRQRPWRCMVATW